MSLSIPDRLPNTIREINNLPQAEKEAIYGSLLPDWLFAQYGIDPQTRCVDGYPVVRYRCPSGSRAIELFMRRHPADRDTMLYLNLADTFNNKLMVLMFVANDPDAPRFNTDVDPEGNRTHFGTACRNLAAEEAAMKAGLAPGQVRRGLRIFKERAPFFEEIVAKMGHSMFLIEPLAYHNTIVFERYGFNYVRGHHEMELINEGFQPGGRFYEKLTPDNPFRQPDAWKTIRGRSWAIHDGILGYPFTGFQMYKRLGYHAGICTFPDAEW